MGAAYGSLFGGWVLVLVVVGRGLVCPPHDLIPALTWVHGYPPPPHTHTYLASCREDPGSRHQIHPNVQYIRNSHGAVMSVVGGQAEGAFLWA